MPRKGCKDEDAQLPWELTGRCLLCLQQAQLVQTRRFTKAWPLAREGSPSCSAMDPLPDTLLLPLPPHLGEAPPAQRKAGDRLQSATWWRCCHQSPSPLTPHYSPLFSMSLPMEREQGLVAQSSFQKDSPTVPPLLWFTKSGTTPSKKQLQKVSKNLTSASGKTL